MLPSAFHQYQIAYQDSCWRCRSRAAVPTCSCARAADCARSALRAHVSDPGHSPLTRSGVLFDLGRGSSSDAGFGSLRSEYLVIGNVTWAGHAHNKQCRVLRESDVNACVGQPSLPCGKKPCCYLCTSCSILAYSWIAALRLGMTPATSANVQN